MPYMAVLEGSGGMSVLCLFCWGSSSWCGLSRAAGRFSCCEGLLAVCCLGWLADLQAHDEVEL